MFGKKSVSLVERAVRAVDRRRFLPPEQLAHGSEDAPLSIGYGQTISQPSLVQEMTRELKLDAQSRVLEIGTGSGFQTALLAEIASAVFTIERIAQLAVEARQRLEDIGYRSIQFRVGDGAMGWPEEAPFDRIMVTAAPGRVPAALIDQLAPLGRMIIPVGPDKCDQMLELITKDADGHVQRRDLFRVRFVPLVTQA